MNNKKGFGDDPSILEAVDNLSSMAEVNLEELSEDVKDKEGIRTIGRWLDPKDAEKTMDSVKGTFKVVHNYLKHIYSKESAQIKDQSMQKGVQSIMALAGEAALKMDFYAKSLKGVKSVVLSKEYQELLEFYQKKILKKFEQSLEKEEAWEKELRIEEDAADIQRRGVKDLETVTRDRDYELFFITKEDGSRFYNKNLARHIRLVADFDQVIGKINGEDPLVQIRSYQDKEAMELAATIKKKITPELNYWIQKSGKYRDDTFIAAMYRAMMGLLLASNSNNLLSRTSAKSSLAYFRDFQVYLRDVLYSIDYQNFINNPPEGMGQFYEVTLQILHKICSIIYTFHSDLRDEYAFLSHIMQKEKISTTHSKTSSLSLWNELLDDHDLLVKELKHFPSGPLFKILDSLLETKTDSEFDPYMHLDRPLSLYVLTNGEKSTTILRAPCPTRQKVINKADILIEFHAALRHMAHEKKKFVLLNLQDRTSWKEFARSDVLEKFQKDAEVRESLDVYTIPKNTSFYLQSDEYLKLSEAADFTLLLLEQIKGEEDCGFYFPRRFDRNELHEFMEKAVALTHKFFFGSKKTLSRKNRLDFIEIVYHLLFLKIMQLSNPDYLAFSGKDGIDQASISTASFYAFTRLISGVGSWKIEEGEFISAMIFLPALFTRERAIDFAPLSRIVSMLSVVTAEMEISGKKVTEEVSKLLGVDIKQTAISYFESKKGSTN